MDRLSSFAVDPVSAQLMLLNVLLFLHLLVRCIGLVRSVEKKSRSGD